MVGEFAKDNALSLNPSKREVVIIAPSRPTNSISICTVNDQPLLPKQNVKCLGFWWSWDLSATKAIDEAITKGRRAFFAYGSLGAFQGKLNLHAGKTIFEVCVIPVLLFGSENWVLTDSLLDRLEGFQGEIGRRILKLSKFHSTLATRIALKWPSVTARILARKLTLLCKVQSDKDSIGCRVYSSLTASDPESIRLIPKCQFLVRKLGCDGVTALVVNGSNGFSSLMTLRKEITEVDWKLCLTEVSSHPSTSLAATIATDTTWPKLWDMALDYGLHGTVSLQAIYRTP